MAEIKHIFETDGGLNQVSVERAISEIRAGRPVAIKAGRSHVLVIGVEALDARLAEVLEPLARRSARLVLRRRVFAASVLIGSSQAPSRCRASISRASPP